MRGPAALPWVDRLTVAVDADNESASTRCDAARTVAVLDAAPSWARAQAGLALTDFRKGGDRPLSELHSDSVARDFSIDTAPGALNVLVARMLVPGGPWPGHFGLEAVVFSAGETEMPAWFPQLAGDPEPVTFAETVGASAAIRDGHGHVIFPELLAVSEPPETQGFGVVLIDRLTDLYLEHTSTAARALGWSVPEGDDPRRLRELAFQAHEWGHRAMDEHYATSVAGHRRRLLAVVSEVTADVAALQMLASAEHRLAPEVTRALVLDRILREAWLPGGDAHVASIVGRHLLQVLARAGAISAGPHGPLLDLSALRPALAAEIAAIEDVYRRGNAGDDEAPVRYLTGYGWAVGEDGMTLADPEPAVERLGSYAQAAQAV